ncbi:hypothetical protein [Methylobacterium nonmethylotrophicum]|uniref:Uncharacterized protein n=1 Tax=Methylobacterium nonmethylotrophicum TaxID=1141884 RepID=A0A4Z0NFY8_9HYPH|nr:hypothetical protein [Methylobacterium nonmethylotrophicum]TGD95238.1 hypothetical protein EU555_28655 [Methylobacterium nonmethylotrophicum]
MSKEYGSCSWGPDKDGVSSPSRIAAPILAIPAWERAYEAVLVGDSLALGARFCPVQDADGGDRARYELAPGTLVAVAPPRSSSPNRAYAVEPDGTVAEVSLVEAEDRIDPAGEGRRSWRRRCVRAGLTDVPTRFTFQRHSYEVGVVYPWGGEDYVAVVTRAGERYVWARAVTYAEAQSLGIA